MRADTRARTAKEVARTADVIITMVPDTPDVEKVLFGYEGVARGPVAGQDRRRHELDLADRDQGVRQKRINDLGCEYVDAPVSGGEVGAKNAALDDHGRRSEAVFDKVKPLFELMGKNITLRRRERRRADGQGRQSDHRRAQHRGGRAKRCCSQPRRAPIRPRSGRR